tara:strand:+ start:12255 stop:13949 length:1695 start_codon:yes stop_codon:yes gene_type:complete
MKMKELDALIEGAVQHHRDRERPFDYKSLLSIVSDVMESAAPQRFIIKEKKDSSGKTVEFTISMIPDIEVSELGWSDVRTPDGEGAPIKGRERQILEAYLENIVGGSGGIAALPQKLEALSRLADNPTAFVESQSAGQTSTEKIKTVISFLVFYKTLTKIIANFNASSAGFSFESFLATLLKGKQIPASGANTIADFVDQDGVKVSLKLYNEASVEVGGSFVDLVGDLVEDGKMTYLVVMKDLKGSREKLSGILKFYKFDFTLDNVMEILKHTKPSSAGCIVLPLDNLEDESEIPARINRKKAFVEIFEELLAQELGSAVADKLLDNEYFQYFTDENNEITTSGTIPLFSSSRTRDKFALMVSIIKDILDIEDDAAAQTAAKLRAISTEAAEALVDLVNQRKEKVGTILPGMEKFRKAPSSPQEKAKYQQSLAKAANESAEVYKGLSTDQKRRALLKTNGYINEWQFSMNKTEVRQVASGQLGSEGDADPSIGVLRIGTESLQAMLDASVAALNTDIFSVFTNLQDLSDSLNAFFAGGLQNDNEAVNAINNADAIEGKTEKMRK